MRERKHDDEQHSRLAKAPQNYLYIAVMHHYIAYGIAGYSNVEKHCANKHMATEIDNISYAENTWMTPVTRSIINTKQKLGLGVVNSKKMAREVS